MPYSAAVLRLEEPPGEDQDQGTVTVLSRPGGDTPGSQAWQNHPVRFLFQVTSRVQVGPGPGAAEARPRPHSSSVLDQGDQGGSLIPPSLILIPDTT